MRSGEEYEDKEEGVLAFEDTSDAGIKGNTEVIAGFQKPPVEVPKTKTIAGVHTPKQTQILRSPTRSEEEIHYQEEWSRQGTGSVAG